ncbi:Mrp/NBP35 family ATP-binding protein [Anaerolineae bacterium CFX9]|nr:Mrp/NBP35 family ATP-binding protein [Anaerolineae bacterium CFX9]
MKHPFTRANLAAKHVIMVISAKGGVGKSTTTVHLAAALQARGRRVGIFDADLHAPNIPALLGVRQKRDLTASRSPLAMLPLEARPGAVDMRSLRPYERYGLAVMSLGLLVGEEQAITPDSAEAGRVMHLLLQRVDWGDLDVLLIDMPPGTGEPLSTFLSEGVIDEAVIVTTRERLAHMDNGRLISLLAKKRLPILGVIENMTHVICPTCGELIELYPAPASDQIVYGAAPILGAVPFDPSLIRQHGGRPLPLRDAASLDPRAQRVNQALMDAADNVLARLDSAHTLPAAAFDLLSEDDPCEDCP